MEFYGSEGKKLKKKDKTVFYYPPSIKTGKKTPNQLIEVPGIFDPESKVKKFVEMCVQISLPDVSSEEFSKIWEEALAKNSIIIEAMETLKSESDSAADMWKSKAYGKAIKVLKTVKIPIVSGEQAMKIPGIGKGIAAHIDEILKTGFLRSQEERLENSIKRQTTLEKFLSIWGVLPRHANQWYAKGHRDIEDLVNEKLTEQQKVGIKYIDDIKEKIRRKEADLVFSVIKAYIFKAYPKSKIEMVGQYRRGINDIEKMDIIISTGVLNQGKLELEEIVHHLSKVGIITDAPVINDDHMMGIVFLPSSKTHRRIDIRLISPELWGVFLLLMTGPSTFETQIRQQASQLGYKLSDKGLFKLSVKDDGDEFIPTKTEKDVFASLEIPYVEPEKRS